MSSRCDVARVPRDRVTAGPTPRPPLLSDAISRRGRVRASDLTEASAPIFPASGRNATVHGIRKTQIPRYSGSMQVALRVLCQRSTHLRRGNLPGRRLTKFLLQFFGPVLPGKFVEGS